MQRQILCIIRYNIALWYFLEQRILTYQTYTQNVQQKNKKKSYSSSYRTNQPFTTKLHSGWNRIWLRRFPHYCGKCIRKDVEIHTISLFRFILLIANEFYLLLAGKSFVIRRQSGIKTINTHRIESHFTFNIVTIAIVVHESKRLFLLRTTIIKFISVC